MSRGTSLLASPPPLAGEGQTSPRACCQRPVDSDWPWRTRRGAPCCTAANYALTPKPHPSIQGDKKKMQNFAVLKRFTLVVSLGCAAVFTSTSSFAQTRPCDNPSRINCYWDPSSGARGEWLMRDSSSSSALRTPSPSRQQAQGNAAECPLVNDPEPNKAYLWINANMLCDVGNTPEKKKNCAIVKACRGVRPEFR